MPGTDAAELLRRSLARGRLGHAYLFSGDDLDSLEDAATGLAQTLFCETPIEFGESGQPLRGCRECLACRRVAHRTHPDVTWVYPESKMRQIGGDQAREVSRVLAMRPAEASRKIAVFVGADRMNATAANAFLKTLEEPPGGSVILLLSTEPARVLETIISRCLRLNFGGTGVRIAAPIRDWVAGFAEAARAPQGGLFARYRLLGQFLQGLAGSRERIEKELSEESPLARYPDANPDQKEQWEKELTAAIEAEYRRSRSEHLAGLHAWLRDIWMIRAGSPGELFLPDLQGASAEIAGRISPDEARQNLEAWETTQRLLHTNVQESLALEVGLLKLRL